MGSATWSLIDEPLEAAPLTRQNPSSAEFIPLSTALDHVAAHERAPKLALVRALAGKVRARGFVQYAHPPYNEGIEQLSPELFTDYPPQHPPARIDWAEGTAVMLDGHPHPACTVHGIEVNKADLLHLWQGPFKRGAKRTSIARLVKQAEASGHPVGSITTPNGTTIHFGQPEPSEANNPWRDDLRRKEAKQ
jgi:hypothetical protein